MKNLRFPAALDPEGPYIGGVKEKWGKLTDDDLTRVRVEGNKENLLGLLQQIYGYAKDKAEQEYNDFIGRYKGKYRASTGFTLE